MLAWVDELPGLKKQPNLVFAAARWHGVPAPGPYAGLRDALLGDDGTIRATIMARSTQTNEVGRLATLLPAFALGGRRRAAGADRGRRERRAQPLPRPVGLRLVDPERAWSSSGPAPYLACEVTGPAAAARPRCPRSAWRGGIDLNPLDVTDPEAMALAGDAGLARAGRPARAAAARDRRRRAPTRRGWCAATCSTSCPALVAEAAAHGTVRGLPQRGGGLPAGRGPRAGSSELMRGLVADGALPLGQQRGARTCCPDVTATRRTPSRTPAASCSASTAGWSAAPTGHGHDLEQWLTSTLT